MATDKSTLKNKFLKNVLDVDDTCESDSSAMYYTACELDSTSEFHPDDSTLEAESLEKTNEKTVVPVSTPVIKIAASLSAQKQQKTTSTPKPLPDRTRGHENDINLVNHSNFNKLMLDFNTDNEAGNEEMKIEIVNKKLEGLKMEPTKPNWRFTSPSNPAYSAPEKDKEPSPGQLQFEKAVTRVSMDYEDLNAVPPPDTGRPSMAINDFHHIFKAHVPAMLPTINVVTESEVTTEPQKIMEREFEAMASGMKKSSIDDMVTNVAEAYKRSKLPKRPSISTAYRKTNSVPEQRQIPVAEKRATWASRKTTFTLPESDIPEEKPVSTQKQSSNISSRKSYLPTKILPIAKLHPERKSLHPAALKPAIPEKAKVKPKMATLKIHTLKVGNRRSSFGKPNVRKSTLPSRASPKPKRKSVMPPPSTYTGAIPKKPTASKSDVMCKYCDKKFAITKALDDHLLLKCPKIPPKDKKKLLGQDYAARELEYSRRTPGNRSKMSAIDASEACCSSSVASGPIMPPPLSSEVPKSQAHAGIVHTPNKQITCMGCGKKFASAVLYTIHMTAEHFPKQFSSEFEDTEDQQN